MSVVFLTSCFPNYMALADVVLGNLSKYCCKHGYRLDFRKGDVGGGPYGFQKMRFLGGVLEDPTVEAVLCTDIDVLVTNMSRRVEEFMDEEHDFFVTRDMNGINCGSVLVRNTGRARDYVSFILSCAGMEENEQAVVNKHQPECLAVLSHPSINSYLYDEYGPPRWGRIGRDGGRPSHSEGNWEVGDFLLHMPGMSLKHRLRVVPQILPQVIYD